MTYGIQINMFEVGYAKSPEIICSNGMGPCIAVGIYDPIQKAGSMIHQPSPNHSNDMEEFIINSLKRYNKDLVKVYACGGAILTGESDVDIDNTNEARLHVEDLLNKYFSTSQFIIRWSNIDVTSELFLDTSNGKFEIEYT